MLDLLVIAVLVVGTLFFIRQWKKKNDVKTTPNGASQPGGSTPVDVNDGQNDSDTGHKTLPNVE